MSGSSEDTMAYLHCIPPVDDTFVDKTPQGNFSFRSVICTNMTIFPAAVLSAQCRGGGWIALSQTRLEEVEISWLLQLGSPL